MVAMTMGRPRGSRNNAPRSNSIVIRRTMATHPPPTPQATDCILWQGSCYDAGYGKKWDADAQRLTTIHRWVMTQIYGPLDPDVDVLHRCDNPPCFRFDHLFIGDAKINGQDMVAKGRGRGQFVKGNPGRWWPRKEKP